MLIFSVIFRFPFPTRESVMLESVSLLHWNRTILASWRGSTDMHRRLAQLNLFHMKSCIKLFIHANRLSLFIYSSFCSQVGIHEIIHCSVGNIYSTSKLHLNCTQLTRFSVVVLLSSILDGVNNTARHSFRFQRSAFREHAIRRYVSRLTYAHHDSISFCASNTTEISCIKSSCSEHAMQRSMLYISRCLFSVSQSVSSVVFYAVFIDIFNCHLLLLVDTLIPNK